MFYDNIIRDVGFVTYSAPPKCWIGAAIATAGSILQNLLGSSAQDKINKANIENQNSMWQKQKDYQDYLNANGTLIHRQALEKAGMNVNAEFGPAVNTSSSVPSVAQLNAYQPDFSGVLQYLAQMPQMKLADAQARQANASAKAQEIENSRQETLDRHLDAYFKDKFPAFDDANVVGHFKHYNKGTIDAQKLEREWEVRSKELDALDVQHQFEKLVNDARLSDSNTVKAVAEMPLLDRRKLYNEVLNLIKDRKVMDSVIKLNDSQSSLADSQEALNVLEEEITRNSNIHELITKYLGDGAMADAAHFITMLIGAVTGNMRFGANLSKFSGKTRSVNTNSNTNRNTSSSRVHVYKHEE